MTESSSYEYRFIKRSHVLFTSAVTLGAALLFLLPRFPFPPGFLGVCIASSVFHLILFGFFDRASPAFFTVANIVNLFMLALSVHYSGGILSPFTMVFALVLISGAGYGASMPVVLGASIGFYTGIIIAEKQGLLPPVNLTAADIYRSWPATLLVLLSVIGFMASSGSIYKVTVNRLRLKIARELEINKTMVDRLARLDAPSQVGLLVHKIAHDVNGPLNAVAGLIQLMREDNVLTAESQEDCRIALQELSRVSHLVNRMVRYVKPGQSERESFCPHDLIETVISVISFLPSATDIKLVKDLTPANAFLIYANKQEIQQVLFNILKNAVEAISATQPEKIITISLKRQGSQAVVTVTDNGCGISKSALSGLGRDMASTKPQGSGIGLLITREIVEAHSGKISFQSVEGRGTTVTLSFPIYDTTPHSTQEIHEQIKTV